MSDIDTSTRDMAASILETTASNFESGRFGWMQGHLTDQTIDVDAWRAQYPQLTYEQGREHSHCAIGALRHAANEQIDGSHCRRELVLDASAYRLALDTLEAVLPERQDVESWNDIQGRTRYDVIELFKLAAKELRNQP